MQAHSLINKKLFYAAYKEELIKMIDLDEPDYTEIIKNLKEDDIPLLTELSKDANMAIATKAVSCLGLMNTEKAVAGLKTASENANPVLRIAAAHALKHSASLPSAVQLVDKLLDDHDIGVRKFALKTVQNANIKKLKRKSGAIEFEGKFGFDEGFIERCFAKNPKISKKLKL